ncbi:MAG: hypothetical protein ACT6QS_14940 [Flavobacteriales bacterium]
MKHKIKRRNWHKDNRPVVFEYFGGICQECKLQLTPIDKWDIHHIHYHYHGKLYETGALELIEKKVITLLCRPCHNVRHTAIDPDNPHHLENKYPCEECGKNERGIFDRKKNENLEKLLCRKCFQKWRATNLNLLEICENCGQKELGLTMVMKAESLDKLLCRLCLKQKRAEYLGKYEKCEICGKHEGGLTRRKENYNLEKLLCVRCFEYHRKGVSQGSLF